MSLVYGQLPSVPWTFTDEFSSKVSCLRHPPAATLHQAIVSSQDDVSTMAEYLAIRVLGSPEGLPDLLFTPETGPRKMGIVEWIETISMYDLQPRRQARILDVWEQAWNIPDFPIANMPVLFALYGKTSEPIRELLDRFLDLTLNLCTSPFIKPESWAVKRDPAVVKDVVSRLSAIPFLTEGDRRDLGEVDAAGGVRHAASAVRLFRRMARDLILSDCEPLKAEFMRHIEERLDAISFLPNDCPGWPDLQRASFDRAVEHVFGGLFAPDEYVNRFLKGSQRCIAAMLRILGSATVNANTIIAVLTRTTDPALTPSSGPLTSMLPPRDYGPDPHTWLADLPIVVDKLLDTRTSPAAETLLQSLLTHIPPRNSQFPALARAELLDRLEATPIDPRDPTPLYDALAFLISTDPKQHIPRTLPSLARILARAPQPHPSAVHLLAKLAPSTPPNALEASKLGLRGLGTPRTRALTAAQSALLKSLLRAGHLVAEIEALVDEIVADVAVSGDVELLVAFVDGVSGGNGVKAGACRRRVRERVEAAVRRGVGGGG
ncbi:hypothetical protein BDK51DRAFT_48214 [Blyttiomyces helicus]|uniref:Uncharacterized protein n=1 Tax=Blyttiomyces helicus TaxID=388810 RepID=A0A4P9W0M8_9FUNG|nr:hypothetical protein BDK51DRAFT_48214 [Blyttiomyces helicus]|eukprot:RKO85689.1 hypothetical protein BDK51DRAFT_48214 [Blyttiomyces helicus]